MKIGRLKLVCFTFLGRRDGVLFELGGAVWLYRGKPGSSGTCRLMAALHLGLVTVAAGYDLDG